MDERLAGVSAAALALDLGRDRALHGAERVHVLDLDLGAERLHATNPQRHVRVAAEGALVHVGVRHLDEAQNLAQLTQEYAGLGGRADVRLG